MLVIISLCLNRLLLCTDKHTWCSTQPSPPAGPLSNTPGCCTGPSALYIAPSLLPDFEGLDVLPAEAEAGAAYVVLGDMGPAMDYTTLNRAFRQLMSQQQPELLSLGKSRQAQRRRL
jgi:hypothetical protein